MAFHRPDAADYDNVASLNQAYLSLLGSETALRQSLLELPEHLAGKLASLGSEQVTRLAGAPFLLFSFRESDDRHWNSLLAERSTGNLFRADVSAAIDTLTSAGLGFIWQLAQRNPYALRLICGAPLSWCEHIAEITFYRLLDAVRRDGSPPSLRAIEQPELWCKLLDGGLSRKRAIRQAAQLSALQVILTTPPAGRSEHWSLAARKVNAPLRRVAERHASRQDR